jgi:minor extracellular serine protease Vpr
VGIYTAAQNYDPNGDLYSPDRYIGVDGTSFAAALVAGAAALVKQAHPSFTPAQVKSAVTNTAAMGLLDYDANGAPFPAPVDAVGAGQLNAQAAVTSNITVDPATVALGVVTSVLPSRTIVITNAGTATVSLQLSVRQRDADANASVMLNPPVLNLAPGQAGPVIVALIGSLPAAGSYEGFITVTGGAVPLQIPYLYLATDKLPANQIPLAGSGFVTELGTSVNTTFRTIDRYGLPILGVRVDFAPSASVYAATAATDSLGTAEAYMTTSSKLGDQSFFAQLEGAGQIEFDGRTRALAQIAADAVVDAASLNPPSGFAPGSYLTIFGSGLSENFETVFTPYLPLSLAGVSVSFDVPARGISVPGALYFVSGGQISLQIPWELAGSETAEMEVTLSNSASRNVRSDGSGLSTNHTQIVSVPIAAYSPAFFEILDALSGQMLVAALDENNHVVSSENPVRTGHALQLYVNGLGPVSGNQPASGALTAASPLAPTVLIPTVTIGGQQATVLFSGLAPLSVGLYQVNALVPETARPGLQSVVISIGGVTSRASSVPVQ